MITLVKAETLPSISYSIEPILRSGTAQIQQLSHQEYAEMFRCQYSEGISVAESTPPDRIPDGVYNELYLESQKVPALADFVEKAKYRLANPLDAFLISRLEDGDHALFAKQAIPKGTILFIYSGKLDWSAYDDGMRTDQTKDSHEGTLRIVDSVHNDPEPGAFDYCQNLTAVIEVDAFKVGGFARFMQHLPKKGECAKSMSFELAESNVHFKQCFVDDSRVLVNVAVANWDINRGEILGFNYGWSFESIAEATLLHYSKEGRVFKKRSV